MYTHPIPEAPWLPVTEHWPDGCCWLCPRLHADAEPPIPANAIQFCFSSYRWLWRPCVPETRRRQPRIPTRWPLLLFYERPWTSLGLYYCMSLFSLVAIDRLVGHQTRDTQNRLPLSREHRAGQGRAGRRKQAKRTLPACLPSREEGWSGVCACSLCWYCAPPSVHSLYTLNLNVKRYGLTTHTSPSSLVQCGRLLIHSFIN